MIRETMTWIRLRLARDHADWAEPRRDGWVMFGARLKVEEASQNSIGRPKPLFELFQCLPFSSCRVLHPCSPHPWTEHIQIHKYGILIIIPADTKAPEHRAWILIRYMTGPLMTFGYLSCNLLHKSGGAYITTQTQKRFAVWTAGNPWLGISAQGLQRW